MTLVTTTPAWAEKGVIAESVQNPTLSGDQRRTRALYRNREKRLALVIGNGAYQEAPLDNPVNDARAMAKTLSDLGFDVIERENTTKAKMEEAVEQFGTKLNQDAVGIVYYSGHGLQVNGKNYLIPVDFHLTNEQSVQLHALDTDMILDQMTAAHSRVNLLILDACRNNPFERRFRAFNGGLAQLNAPEGTIIAYATAPGKVASDGSGINSPYTQSLLTAMRQPGQPVEQVFKQVRAAVSAASNGAQVPWESSSLVGDFYFVGPTTVNVTVQPSAAPTPSVDRDALFWQSIKSSTNPDDFKSYLEQFPNGTYAALARSRLTQSQRPSEPTGHTSSAPVGKQFDCHVPTGMMVRADANACKNFGGVLMR